MQAPVEEVYDCINNEVAKADQTKPEIVAAITTAIMNAVVSTTTVCNEADSVNIPSAEATEREKQAVMMYKDVLRKYAEAESLQLHVVCAIQTAAQALNNPPKVVNRWFEYMYDMDVVLEQVYDLYKDDSSLGKELPYKGKNVAMNSAVDFFARLSQGTLPPACVLNLTDAALCVCLGCLNIRCSCHTVAILLLGLTFVRLFTRVGVEEEDDAN